MSCIYLFLSTILMVHLYIPDQKGTARRRTAQLSGRSQVIGQFRLYRCKGMPGTVALHVFCNLVSKMC